MSEPTPEQPTPTATPSDPASPVPAAPAATITTEPETFTQDDVDRIVRERAERLYRQKVGEGVDIEAIKKKAADFDAAQEASKTEQERAADAARQAQQDAAEARAEALRYKAAATHGIGQDHFDLLGSGDEETITARAERLGGLLKSAASLTAENEQLRAEVEALRAGKPAPLTARPVETLRPGATPANTQTQEDADYVALFGPTG